MALTGNKTTRYYYWLLVEFFRKHSRIVLLSFFVSVIFVVSMVAVSPYIAGLISSQKRVIGIVGVYKKEEFERLPEEILQKVSVGLTAENQKGVVLPMLAATWQRSQNGLSYRFKLRKDILMNDNTPFTTKVLRNEFPDVTMKVIDDFTVEYTLSSGQGVRAPGIFPLFLTRPIFKDSHVGVGGAYTVNKLSVSGGRITRIRLTPLRDEVTPLEYVFYPNEGEMITAYKLGEITEMTITSKTQADMFARWNNSKVQRNVDYTRLMTVFFNMGNPTLKEKDYRDAVESSIDYSKLAELGELATGSIPPISWAVNTEMKKKVYDIEYARKTFKKYSDSTASATLRLVTYYEYLDMSDRMEGFLKEAGAKVETTLATSTPVASAFDIMVAYLIIPSDPDQYYYWHSEQEFARYLSYKNLRIDNILERGRDTFKVTERKKAYTEFQRVLADDPPGLFLYYPYVYQVKRT